MLMHNSMGLGIDVIYSFVIIVCSLMIYFGTKEIYSLTKYEGLNYFRKAFLFFALAYLFRSLIRFLIQIFGISLTSPRTIGTITLFLFMYFSSMAIFYLLYSVMWKKFHKKQGLYYIFQTIAIIIALISILIRTKFVLLSINLILLLFVAFLAYDSYKKSKKKQKLYAIYSLLLIFWIFNIIDLLIPNFFQIYQLFIYLISLAIFLTILYKVLTKIGT